MKRLTLTAALISILLLLASCGAASPSGEASDSAGSTEEASSPAKQNEAWAQAYARVLENTDKLTDPAEPLGDWDYSTLQDYYQEDFYFDKYTLHDVNGDGIPELFMFLPKSDEDQSQVAVIVVYREGKYPEPIGYDAYEKYNSSTQELIVHGHWHGSEGSGKNEWHAYKLDGDEMDMTMAIDYGTPEMDGYMVWSDGDFNDGQSKEAYDSEYDKHVKGAEDISSWGQYDLTDPKGFDEYGGAPDIFYDGKELSVYKDTIKAIGTAIENRNGDAENIPYDLSEAIAFGSDTIPCYYALYDLDGDGTKEMVIGLYEEGEDIAAIRPVGIYTIKENEPYLFSKLMYFDQIVEHKWIITYQGNGVQEGHEDGYCFVLENGELKEVPVNEAAGGAKDFAWHRIR